MVRRRATARALVVDPRGRVLAVVHHGDPDKIGLPGGRLEPGESPEHGAARELEEETGLRARTMVPICVVVTPRRSTSYFLASASGRIRSSLEGPTVWVDPKQLCSGRHGEETALVLDELARKC